MNDNYRKAFDRIWKEQIEKEGNCLQWIKGVKGLCQMFFEEGAETFKYRYIEVEDELSTEEFELWWKIYDKKVSRKACMLKWSRMKPQEQQACIEATKAYVEATPDKQYRKNPLTYLNNKSWNDEIIARKNVRQQSIRIINRMLNEQEQMDGEIRF